MKVVCGKIQLTKEDAERVMSLLSVYLILNITDFEGLAEIMVGLEEMTSRYELDRWEPMDQLHHLLEYLYRS